VRSCGRELESSLGGAAPARPWARCARAHGIRRSACGNSSRRRRGKGRTSGRARGEQSRSRRSPCRCGSRRAGSGCQCAFGVPSLPSSHGLSALAELAGAQSASPCTRRSCRRRRLGFPQAAAVLPCVQSESRAALSKGDAGVGDPCVDVEPGAARCGAGARRRTVVFRSGRLPGGGPGRDRSVGHAAVAAAADRRHRGAAAVDDRDGKERRRPTAA